MRSKNISLADPSNTGADVDGILDRLLRDELGERVLSVKKVPGGVNSEAFRVFTDHKNVYFAKKYFTRKGDKRDRLSTEFAGLSFLWKNGVKNIPEPMAASKKDSIAVYRYIDGVKIRPGEITAGDIDQAAIFAGKLHSLAGAEGAAALAAASEACFSIKEYLDCVEDRAGKLKAAAEKRAAFGALRSYLDNEFFPVFETVKKNTKDAARAAGIGLDEKIGKEEKTLSASDFGFHNALKAPDGGIFFIDLEYYGWDDPAKMIADFYLQPAVPVPQVFRMRFFDNVRKNYPEGAGLEKRLSIIYPLLGLKWCLIMLNVFIHSGAGRINKAFSSKQISKAVKKLEEIREEMEMKAFPIGGLRGA
ncbi:MAG: phosphotransferase [Candidatus Omnitrophica bacterium]|nr:phosphotransferase [Candidatus Omnitrophota bacterium]